MFKIAWKKICGKTISSTFSLIITFKVHFHLTISAKFFAQSPLAALLIYERTSKHLNKSLDDDVNCMTVFGRVGLQTNNIKVEKMK